MRGLLLLAGLFLCFIILSPMLRGWRPRLRGGGDRLTHAGLPWGRLRRAGAREHQHHGHRGPRLHEFRDVAGVDLIQRRVALVEQVLCRGKQLHALPNRPRHQRVESEIWIEL